jgi:hypothetical protein
MRSTVATSTNNKAPYVRPSMQRLGSIGSLTAGGSGPTMEVNIGGMRMDRTPRV